MKNKILQEKRLSEVIKLFPQIKILHCLGSGNKGEAYLMEDGSVMKITIDKEEYYTARTIKGRRLKHVIDIYECYKFECIYDDGDLDNLFCIKEELLDTTSKKEITQKFVALFKRAWFSIYFSDIAKYQGATFDDLDEYMRNPNRYSKAINFTKEYIISEGNKLGVGKEFDDIYNQLLAAYIELYKFAPKSHLDLNDGNIGFTSEGALKIFDMQ